MPCSSTANALRTNHINRCNSACLLFVSC